MYSTGLQLIRQCPFGSSLGSVTYSTVSLLSPGYAPTDARSGRWRARTGCRPGRRSSPDRSPECRGGRAFDRAIEVYVPAVPLALVVGVEVKGSLTRSLELVP